MLVAGDPRLRTRCTEVGDADCAADIAQLAAALAAARARHGFGRAIAAPQLGVLRRIVVLDLGAGPIALIDPEITWRSPDQILVWDDCFSVPDRIAQVRRHRSISLRYRDAQRRVRTWSELPLDLAELVQHELDHLDGVLMIDRAERSEPIARHAELVGAARPAHRLSLDRIAGAAAVIDPVFLRSPLFACEPLGMALKIETLNPIRSFKGRGAELFVAQSREPGPFVCASAGNFGQAMAYACRKRGIGLTVFAARTANPMKVERMRALGAEVVLAGDDFQAAKQAARQHGGRFVEDGQEPLIAEGAGTIAVELGDGFDAVVVPIGDGALIGGMARWLKAAAPATRVIGVVAAGAPAMRESWLRGEVVAHATSHTIADGIDLHVPVAAALADLRALVDDIVMVDDAQLVEAMRAIHAHAGLIAEASGAAGVAAIRADPARFAGLQVATVLTGSNVAPA